MKTVGVARHRNWLPAVIAFAPALLLPLVQDVLRHLFRHSRVLQLLGSAPDLIVAFCFPFSILVRPMSWTRRLADMLFAVWCAFTLSVLVAVEYLSPFGRNTFDPWDLLASAFGVGVAILGYRWLIRGQLCFFPEPDPH